MAKSDVQKSINEIKESFGDIDRAILDGTKNYRLLQASISRTNDILGSTNWQIFSRFISGTPLWRIQNRVKASVMLLNEFLSSSERSRLEDAKRLKVYAEIAKVQRGTSKFADNLRNVAKMGAIEAKEEIQALREKSELFDGLMFYHQDHTLAAEELLKILDAQNEQAEKLQKKAKRSAEAIRERRELEGAGIKERMKAFIGLNRFKKRFDAKTAKEAIKAFIKTSDQKLEITKKMSKEARKLGLTESDLERLKNKDGDVGKLKSMRSEKDGRTYRHDAKGVPIDPETFSKLAKIQEMAEKQNSLTSKATRLALKPYKAIVAIAAAVKKLVFYAAAQFMKLMLLLLVIVAAFKLIQPFLGNIFDAIKTMAKVFIFGFEMMASGLAELFTGVYNLFAGLITGDMDQAIKGLGQIIVGVVESVVGIFVATVGTLLSGIVSFVASAFMDGFDKLGGGISGVIAGIGNVVKAVAAVAAGVAMVVAVVGMLFAATIAFPALLFAGFALLVYFGVDLIVATILGLGKVLAFIAKGILNIGKFIVSGIVSAIKSFIQFIVDKLSPGKTIKKFVKKIPFLATGGKVKNSGIAVVGEKGPELVNLPAGARVNSNRDSAAMMSGNTIHNHITVQVTGRVGASDTEIRDIANKVAREINTRMNRTSTSVVKF